MKTFWSRFMLETLLLVILVTTLVVSIALGPFHYGKSGSLYQRNYIRGKFHKLPSGDYHVTLTRVSEGFGFGIGLSTTYPTWRKEQP
jgi:hypothetical protein